MGSVTISIVRSGPRDRAHRGSPGSAATTPTRARSATTRPQWTCLAPRVHDVVTRFGAARTGFARLPGPATHGETEIRADPDTTNTPMAATFERVGYFVTQRRMVLPYE
jgi:hypothetical protein